jgi:ubiquinone/menaquinone biosynthesis C-methylase UbiE
VSEASQTDAIEAGTTRECDFASARPPHRISTSEGYRLWAVSYDCDPNPLLALEERILEPILPDMKGKTVVDLACGTGRWLARLLAKGAKSGFGIDCSEEMLERAIRKPGLAGAMIQGDCTALPFRDSFADVMICSFALGHIANLPGFALELARATRAGSNLFLTDLHPIAYQSGWLCGFRHAGIQYEIPVRARPIAEVHRVFESQGFALRRLIEPFLGEPEIPIFELARKRDLFKSVRDTPAIFVCHFMRSRDQRKETPIERRVK